MKKGFILLAIFFTSCNALCAQDNNPVSEWATAAAANFRFASDVVYLKANGYECKLDIIAAGDPGVARPTFIYIHGGGWSFGSKDDVKLVGLPYLAKGMNFVNVGYRLASISLAPAAVEDCRCALRWVYLHAKDFGVDLTRLVVSGGSAGGHLALMTGMLRPSDGFDNLCAGSEDLDLKVAAVVSDRGPIDIPEILERHGPSGGWYAERWFGSLPNRLALAQRLSPINYVRPGLPPILMVHGDSDEWVPYKQAVRLHEELTRAGVINELLTVPGGTHTFTPEQKLRIQETIFRFLRQQKILLK